MALAIYIIGFTNFSHHFIRIKVSSANAVQVIIDHAHDAIVQLNWHDE
jgi:hypothetical protein